MNTNARLFLAGSLGAVAGGLLTNHYSHSAEIAKHLIFLATLLGIIIGCLTASFTYDPRGSTQVFVSALRCVFPLAWRAIKATPSVIGIVVRFSVLTLSKLFVLAVFSAMSFLTWYLLAYGAMGEWLTALMLSVPATVVGMMCTYANYDSSSEWFFMFFRASWKDNLRYSSWSMVCSNAIAVVYYVLLGLFWLLRKIIVNMGAIICSIAYLVLLITTGLTACQRRSAAMVGAIVGTILGLYFTSPVLLGFSGGVTAVLTHFVACTLQARIPNWKAQLRPVWTS